MMRRFFSLSWLLGIPVLEPRASWEQVDELATMLAMHPDKVEWCTHHYRDRSAEGLPEVYVEELGLWAKDDGFSIHYSMNRGHVYPDRRQRAVLKRAFRLFAQAKPPCRIVRHSDQMLCNVQGCGASWDANDPHPPSCPKSGRQLPEIVR